MSIVEFVKEKLGEHVDDDPARFDELWSKESNLNSQLVEILSGSGFLEKNTLDGWYLIKKGNNYSMYYQERGCTHWGEDIFDDETEALKAFLKVITDIGL